MNIALERDASLYLSPPAGRGRIALAIRVRGAIRALPFLPRSLIEAHPNPPRASFARLDPAKSGEREK